MSTRIEHIDIAKGISIVLVALFHSELRGFFPSIIEPMALFRMPLFFFLAGLFFSWSQPPETFFYKKSEALLKPYFSVLLLLFLASFLKGDSQLSRQFIGILYGNADTIRWGPMWFLTHLFAVYCFCYGLFRYTGLGKLTPIARWAIAMVFLVVGVYNLALFRNLEISLGDATLAAGGLPFSADIILVTSAFFMAGHLLRRSVVNFQPNHTLFGLSLFIFILIAALGEAHLDLNLRVFTAPLWVILGAALGIYMVLHISMLLARTGMARTVLVAVGSASLYILIFHHWVGGKAYQFLSGVASAHVNALVLSLIAFLISILVPMGIRTVIHRSDFLALFFLPFRANRSLQQGV